MQRNKVGEPRLFKLFGHFSLALLLSAGVLSAGSFEDFKRSQVQEFQKYKDERDNAFNNYLKEQWKAYNAYKGTPLYEKPKPKKIAPAQPKPIKSVGPKVTIKVKEVEQKKPELSEDLALIKEPVHVAPPKEIEAEKKVEPKKDAIVEELPKAIAVLPKKIEVEPEKRVKIVKKDINFNFYGTDLGFDIPSKIKSAKFYPQDQSGISSFFDSAASSEYEDLIRQIASTKESLNLNDWGLYLLVLQISNHTFSDQDESRLLSWFIFNKLGYAVKIGLAKNHVVLMHYSKKIIYSTPNYSFSNQKFYVVANYAKGSVGQLFSYKQNYPGADKELDLSLKELPNFKSNMKSKTLSFKQYSNTYDVTFEYNQNLIDFMATYPQADYETFFNAPVDERTYESIAKSLKKYVDGKKTSDAMNFVLNFVQNSFAYERDDQQFGREKVMFAQETLYFDKSDCEDRAVLFSYLIKELFGIGVVGVKYKDHMATALYVPMEGDTVNAGSRRFVVADPTYINASIGQSMPKYKPLKPESFVIVRN